MWKELWWWMVGKWCPEHNIRFRSDLCPRHNRLRVVRGEAYDRRLTARAEGQWPGDGRGQECSQ